MSGAVETPPTEEVLYEIVDGVAIVTLNRPHRLNAFTMSMERQLEDLLREADTDASVRCIVITGAGRGFCTGDDVEDQWNDPEMAESVAHSAHSGGVTPLLACLLAIRTPTVAAVNGPAVGIGMDLALFCDVRFAGPKARFGQGYLRMGLVADIGGTWLLPQLVGRMEATRLLLSGEIIDAAEATRIGLALAAQDALEAAQEFARQVASQAPLAIAATLDLLRAGTGVALADIGPIASARSHALVSMFATEDHKESVAAFVAGRKPVFHSR